MIKNKIEQNDVNLSGFFLKYFPSALFPKLWNSLELELKETKSEKLFKIKIFKNYLDSYVSYICKRNCFFMWIN